jgi:hypothetical protein
VAYPENPTSLRPQLYHNSNRALSAMQLQLSALLSLLTVALFAVPALSLNIIVYISDSGCIGASFTYFNVLLDTCFNFPIQFGYSVLFQGLGLGSVGVGFAGNSCTSEVLFTVSLGADCWNSRGSRRVGSMSWQRAGSLLQDGQTKGPAPSLFTYDDHVGVENTIVVPADDEDAAQKIADLYEAKDFEALAKYGKLQ